jgi:hypothetical protein
MTPDREVDRYKYPFCGDAEPYFWKYILSLTDPFSVYDQQANPVYLDKQPIGPAIVFWKPKKDFGCPTGLVTTGDFAGFIGDSFSGPRMTKSIKLSRTLAPDGAMFNQEKALESIEKRLNEGLPLESLKDILINGGELCYPKLIVESLKIIRYPVNEAGFLWNIRQFGVPYREKMSLQYFQNIAASPQKTQPEPVS